MRPLGVTLSACFQFFRGALVGLLGLGALLVGGLASRFASLAAEGNRLQQLLSGFGHLLGLALLIYAFVLILLGVGLLLRQNWARVLTIIFSGFVVLLHLPGLILHRPLPVLLVLLNLVVLVYLLLPEASSYFQNRQLPPSNPA